MTWSLAQPVWMLLALLALPLGVIALRWFVSMGRLRRWSAVISRALLLTLIAAMLAGVSSVRTTDDLAVIGVVDLSGSVERFADLGFDESGQRITPAAAARAYMQQATADRGLSDLLGVVVFDGQPAAGALPSRAGVLDRTFASTGTDGSDIASAIRMAAGLIPPDASGRIVLFSDGNETRGDARRAAASLAAASLARVPIDVVPMPIRGEREVLVEAVDAPPRASSESTVSVRTVLRATGAASGTLRLLVEGEPVDANGDAPGTGLRLRLDPGRRTVTVPVELGTGRVHRFEAVFEPDLDSEGKPLADTSTANNRGRAFTITPGRGSVLLVDGTMGEGGVLGETLRGEGIGVEVISPGAMPTDLLTLEGFDLVILQDVAGDEMPSASHDALTAFVRELGGGLVMIGGPKSFGAGGWKGTPIEPILPVKLDLPDKIVSPELAIVFVLDNSGSMARSVLGSSKSQQQIANEAAALAVGSLDERDLIGVVSFNNGSRLVVPLRGNAKPGSTQSAIRSIGSGGGTNLGPALELAKKQLETADAKSKHVIVLSDGQSMHEETLPGIAERMHAAGISITTIAVGDKADTATMQKIADRGGGAFYEVTNPSVLPRVFLRAVRVVRTPMIREQPFDPVVLPTGSPLTGGLGAVPPLGGLVLTQARSEPTVTTAIITPKGEPVLAHWPVELGQVVAFTSDAHHWASPWLEWPGYRAFWTRLVRSTARPVRSTNHELRVTESGGELRLHFEAIGDDGRPLDGLVAAATVYGADGRARKLLLDQVGPGVYEGRLNAGGAGSHIAVVTPRAFSGGSVVRMAPVLGGVSVSGGLEDARLTTNIPLLSELADMTGGRMLDLKDPVSAAFFDRTGIEPRRAMTPLWPVLLGASLVVFLFDVGTRRVAWDRWLNPEMGGGLRQRAHEAVVDRSVASRKAARTLRSRQDHTQRAKRHAAVTKPTGLTDADAAQTLRRVREQRKEAERKRLAEVRERMKREREQPGETASDKRVHPEAQADEASGLLAAKRRARGRFGLDADNDSGDKNEH